MKVNVTTPIVESHTPALNGRRKANMSMGGSPGFCMIRLMLKSINGLLKSMTNSRSAVIVMGARAMSFSCKRTEQQRFKIKAIVGITERSVITLYSQTCFSVKTVKSNLSKIT